ncbi:hypothetical protein BPODLACK_01771 [Gordonia sp. YY1]|nr:hypothetical protein BPODLACK_01771 [Gordonia sp. YY1]GAC51350.1 hypothetical protein GOAMI_01_00550 [Gordonia amicalis NBRC 100051 = JCM 11271]
MRSVATQPGFPGNIAPGVVASATQRAVDCTRSRVPSPGRPVATKGRTKPCALYP